MFCRNCGTQLPDGTAFCSNCGQGTTATAPPTQAPPVQMQQPAPPPAYQQAPQYPQQPPPYPQTPPIYNPYSQPKSSSTNVAIFLVILAFAVALVVGFLVIKNASMGPEKDAVLAVIRENLDACRRNDIEGIMATMDPQSPKYEQTRNVMEQMMSQQYVLSYEMKEARVTSISDTEARVHVVQVTRKISGPDFRDNEVTVTDILVKRDGQWKLSDTIVEHINYL